MNKLLLGLLLSVGVVMANETPKDDLLAMVTMGKTSGVEVEMNKSEMKDADGGYSYRGYGSSYYNSNTRAGYSSRSSSRIYARAFGRYYWGRQFGN